VSAEPDSRMPVGPRSAGATLELACAARAAGATAERDRAGCDIGATLPAAGSARERDSAMAGVATASRATLRGSLRAGDSGAGRPTSRIVEARDGSPMKASRGAAGEQPPDAQNLTRILQDVAAGRARPSDVLLPLVYDQLRAIARQRLRQERASHTLNATALVHEAYMRLAGDAALPWENRAHFFGAAARAMRRILIEHARKRGRQKRGGQGTQVPLSLLDLVADADAGDVLAVDDAVEKLCARDPRMAEIVHLRFYAGLSVEETAAALDISDRTVRRDWNLARAWLARELER
jgi:RNA polymerase sigma factor (TIGR02999 family)